MSTTQSEIAELIRRHFDIAPEGLDPNLPLSDSGMDSLTLIELVFELEDHFHISVPESRTDIQTLAGLATLVDELRAVAKP